MPIPNRLLALLLLLPSLARASALGVSDNPTPDSFALVANHRAASLYVDEHEPKVVHDQFLLSPAPTR